MAVLNFTVGRRRALGLSICGFLAVIVSVTAVRADLSGTQPEDRRAPDRMAMRAVSQLLKTRHLSKHPLDDEISQRGLKAFLKTLDPMKLYFYQSDVDRFSQRANDLDEMANAGDASFAYEVFGTYLKRVDEREKLAQQLLAEEHDFTVDEEMVADADEAKYPASEAEARDLWRKRVKYDILMEKTKDDVKTLDKAREKLAKRYKSFARRMHQTDGDELLEMFLSSITTSYDPHTSYMSASNLENFSIVMRLKLEGIGAALQSRDGETIVNKIIPGGAADKDGRLKPEDRVIGVGQGDKGEIEDVTDMKLTDVVNKIRGDKGTIVRLQVVTVGGKTEIYNVTRAEIELKDSEARGKIIDAGSRQDGKPYRIGVINLPSFYMDMDGARRRLPDYKSTTRDVRKILDQFRKDGVDAVLMDLRNNGGGSLNEAISLTGLFIDEGPIVQVKDAGGNVQSYDDLERGVAWDGPLVVLINKFSASASEIFAGAIQDYRRGLIIGDHATHGKGTVQTLSELGRELFLGPNPPDLGALKITMQKFYRPNGDSTQNRGVVSDIELPSLTTHLPVGESDLDYAMEFDRVDPSQFKRVNQVDRTVIDQLNDLSSRRRDASAEFKKALADISRYQDRKNRKSVTLNEEKFLAERAELDAEKKAEEELEESESPTDEIFKRDFYTDEALAITVDYLRLFKLAAK
ncbi:MAG: carboxy terminal-processing peptidase [Pirellulales bacterium]|nr:carboxy terminal-processing peptidase [Pirellulales bacterium]